MLAPKPLAMDIPAGSSAPELILNPVDNSVRVFCRACCVEDSVFSATKLETLFRTLIIGIAPCIEFRLHRTSPFIAKSGTATWSRWVLTDNEHVACQSKSAILAQLERINAG
jgi:hypothetical protein